MYLFFKTVLKGVALNREELSPFAYWLISNQIIPMLIISILFGLLIIMILKHYMKQEKNLILLFVIATIIIGFSFYWFNTRPAKIKTNCANEVYDWIKEKSITTDKADLVETRLNLCLHQHGLSR